MGYVQALLSTVCSLPTSQCESYAETLSGASISAWLAAFEGGRVGFLKQLADSGVAKLADRQAIANALSRAKREGRA